MLFQYILKRWLLAAVILFPNFPCFAQGSANFQLLQSNIASGGGAFQSANLKLVESTIGGFAIGGAFSNSFRLNGAALVTSVENVDDLRALPEYFLLLQNYPNPFNPETTIEYALPQDTDVKINIFNALGQVVRTLDRGFQKAGNHRVVWEGRNETGAPVSSGVYYYQMVAEVFNDVRKMLLLR